MAAILQAHVDILDRLTDPTDQAIADLRQELWHLRQEVYRLTVAKDERGEDDKEYLEYLVSDVEDAVDHLAQLIEERPR